MIDQYLQYLQEGPLFNIAMYSIKERHTIKKCLEECRKLNKGATFCKAKCFKPPKKEVREDQGFFQKRKCEKLKRQLADIPKGVAVIRNMMNKRCVGGPDVDPAKLKKCKDFHQKYIDQTKASGEKIKEKMRKAGC